MVVPDILKDAILARLDDQEGLMTLPALMSVLLPVYEGSTLKRQAGKLTITPEGAHWRVTIDCPSEVISARIACASLVNLFSDVNLALGERRVAWAPGWQKNKKKLPTVDDIIQ